MTITLTFMAIMLAIAIRWFFTQKVTAKPWTQSGAVENSESLEAVPVPASKLGLWLFLAVVTSLFSLFASAYFIRMDLSDWAPLPEPAVVWANTVILVLSSIAMQWAWGAAQKNQLKTAKNALLCGGFFAFLFLAGQLLAWQELNAGGYFMTANPANAFFYVITAVHALHLIGGLWVWAKTADKLWRKQFEVKQVLLTIELCSVYWHYLLLVWIALFGLLLST